MSIHHGIWKSAEKIEWQEVCCIREVRFLPKSTKKCNFGPKVQNNGFWPHMVHKNEILIKECDLV